MKSIDSIRQEILLLVLLKKEINAIEFDEINRSNERETSEFFLEFSGVAFLSGFSD